MLRPSRKLFKVIGISRKTQKYRQERDTLREWVEIFEELPFIVTNVTMSKLLRDDGIVMEVGIHFPDLPDDPDDDDLCCRELFSLDAKFFRTGTACIGNCTTGMLKLEDVEALGFQGTWEEVALKLIKIGYDVDERLTKT